MLRECTSYANRTRLQFSETFWTNVTLGSATNFLLGTKRCYSMSCAKRIELLQGTELALELPLIPHRLLSSHK
jgi:hypothetical protein